MSLSVDQAIPCGLLLNELVTNAVKHAFRGGRRGTLRVELSRLDETALRLTVADDGVGAPSGFDIQGSESLGLQIVATLVEQLDADLSVDGRNGMKFDITIPTEAG